MKKQVPIYLPTTATTRPAPDSVVTIDTDNAQLRNRLIAYIEQFDVAEALVLKMRGRTTQLVELRANPDEPLESLYRAWIGTQFVGTVLARFDDEAEAAMRKHLLSCGYTKHSMRNLVVRSAVCKWPSGDLLEHLGAQT